MKIDLTTLPSGKRYEDQYGAWLELFKTIAESEIEIEIYECPTSWCSLIYYLGGKLISTKGHFQEDSYISGDVMTSILEAESKGRLRELVEFHSTLRPELVDALYKSDMEWKTKNRRHQIQKSFVITNNGSFHRPEVLYYLNEVLPKYKPTKDRCVLCPCAADKPYPAPLHQAILEVIPDDVELIIATGVLGLVPQSLWSDMPLYDSGIPNQWRLSKIVSEYFSANKYKQIVVYSDFYNIAIYNGLMDADPTTKEIDGYGWYEPGMPDSTVKFVTPIKEQDYLNLLDSDLLAKLKQTVNEF